MRRLLLALVGAVALVLALDRAVPVVLSDSAAAERAASEQHEAVASIVYRRLSNLRVGKGATISRAQREWEAIPTRKAPGELRVFIIGNSTAQFSILPPVVERRLRAAFPEREVSVHSLMIPGVAIADEALLARAALAKRADVVVLTPNTKELNELVSDQAHAALEQAFALDTSVTVSSGPAERIRAFLRRHWRLYRYRDELREIALRRVAPERGDVDEETQAIAVGVRAIAEAAAEGDMHVLVDAYRTHRMGALIDAVAKRPHVPEDSPLFGAMRAMATEITQAGALGIGIFLPMNPIFHAARTAAEYPYYYVDDAYLRALAARTLGIYRDAGFVTANRIDALPAPAFIDLSHANADGLRAFSDEAARTIEIAMRGWLRGHVRGVEVPAATDGAALPAVP
jgi:hypothetical protein